MAEFTGTRQADFVLPPRVSQIGRYATSTTFAASNLSLVGNQTVNASNMTQYEVGAPGTYVRVTATGADAWIAFGSSSSVSSGLDATTAAVNGSSGCVCVPAGTYQDYRLERGTDTWIGYGTASGTGLLTVFISSPR